MGVVDAPEVIVAASREEAVSAFGDGADVTVVAGGTIVMPDITHGRLQPAPGAADRPRRPVGRAQRAAAARRSARRRRSPSSRTPPSRWAPARAASPTSRSAARPRSAATCARRRASETPRGDLQAALLALDAQVRSTGAGGERTEPVEDFLAAGPAGRLVLDVEFADPEAGASAERAPAPRPRLHDHARLRRPRRRRAARRRLGRRAHRRAQPRGRGARVADGADAAAAAERVLDDVTPHDDALASSWYRGRTLPVLVRRALDDLR